MNGMGWEIFFWVLKWVFSSAMGFGQERSIFVEVGWDSSKDLHLCDGSVFVKVSYLSSLV